MEKIVVKFCIIKGDAKKQFKVLAETEATRIAFNIYSKTIKGFKESVRLLYKNYKVKFIRMD